MKLIAVTAKINNFFLIIFKGRENTRNKNLFTSAG